MARHDPNARPVLGLKVYGRPTRYGTPNVQRNGKVQEQRVFFGGPKVMHKNRSWDRDRSRMSEVAIFDR